VRGALFVAATLAASAMASRVIYGVVGNGSPLEVLTTAEPPPLGPLMAALVVLFVVGACLADVARLTRAGR
jgi:hypothetical protein